MFISISLTAVQFTYMKGLLVKELKNLNDRQRVLENEVSVNGDVYNKYFHVLSSLSNERHVLNSVIDVLPKIVY